jgi:type IV pilus assembly protein PilY1
MNDVIMHHVPATPALPLKKLGLAAAVLIAGSCHAAMPEVNLAASPLSGSANVHPNVLLSLSIDQTASRAAYKDGHETYDRTRKYMGYFNPLKCYAYQGGNRNVTSGYFHIVRDADSSHECSNAFSGNFMNWAATSLLDMLRYALSGGDRVVDTLQTTVLQRATLSDNAYADFQYFPRKVLKVSESSSPPNRVTPFNVNELFVVSCRNRIFFSDVQGNSDNCDTPAHESSGKLARTDKRLGEYLVRVQVCDRHEGATRTDLCRAYGKYYKPVGVIQQYAEEMRFGITSYLLDPSERRYGGVLRAPMNYVGKNGFSIPGSLAEPNPASEWDQNTGIIYANSVLKSKNGQSVGGLINYINQFGRSGHYRHFDPISELYYEGLRYLQGKAQTQAAIDGMQDTMKDDLPVVEFGADPVTTHCQLNKLISIGDANTHWDRYLPGNQRTSFDGMQPAYDPIRPVEPAVAGKTPALDVKPWTAKVGGMEADPAGRYGNPSPRPGLSNLHMLDTGADGHGSYYIAGLAYWANTQDIRQDKPVRVRTLVLDLDDGGNGTLDGGRRVVKPRDSQLFLASKYGGFRDANKDGNPFVTYEADGKQLVRSSNDEWEIEHSGMPETYFLAGDPLQLVQGIRRAFAIIANDGSDNFAEHVRQNLLVSNAGPGSGDNALYQAGFNRARWSGSLKKFAVNTGEQGEAVRSSMPIWEAGVLLSGTERTPPVPLPSERKIYTSFIQPGKPIRTMEFAWKTLEETQRMALSAAPDHLESSGLGEKRVEYLRGVRTLEMGRPNGLFRARRSVLGDAVNSAPLYVGAPASLSQDIDYATFLERHRRRAGVIYLGANDGMLHAFDAGNGMELFAYIPNALFPSLSLLTYPDYVHRPYMDGGIAVSEAKIAGHWRTVLAAGMGAGAQGVFALDVSDPAHFNEGLGAIWEFTDSDDPDMGNITGAPQIAKFRTKSSDGTDEYGYFVVLPSGLNNYKADGAGKFSSSGRAALFLLSLQKDPNSPWKQGVNYYKIKLPVGDERIPNGLSPPVLGGSSDGIVDHAYAGDLQGNLWRFDFKEGAPWSKALGSSPRPLFVARDESGRRQPITAQPKLVYATANSYMVLFGTGKFLEASDAASARFQTQSFYGIRDKPAMRSIVDGRKALSARRLLANAQSGEFFLEQPSDNMLSLPSATAGWYFDLPESGKTGERAVFNPVTVFGRLFLSTLLPSSSPCERDGSRLYVMDALSGLPVEGSAMGYALEPGITGSPLLLHDLVEISGPQTGGRRKARKRHSILDPNRSDADEAKPKLPFGRGQVLAPAGRLSWREITNWQELRDEALRK